MSEVRTDEPFKNGNCKDCTHCILDKNPQKCDMPTTTGKYVNCREVRVCSYYNKV